MLRIDKQQWGYRWGVSFLETDLQLTYNERLELLIEATDMYLSDEKERRVKNEKMEGVITTDNRRYLLGDFGGKKYEARIDIGSKHAYLSFLVKEYINPSLN
ncbi:MAG: hypothetical protein WC916_01760 [Candidatus Woesearchaeota archaeon]